MVKYRDFGLSYFKSGNGHATALRRNDLKNHVKFSTMDCQGSYRKHFTC